jgi:hypothetical protein
MPLPIAALLAAGGAIIPPIIQAMTSGKGHQPEQQQQINRFQPWQSDIQKRMAQFAMPQLMDNKFDFAPIEAEARKGYQQQTIPSIMQRFASNNNLGSSGLNYALSGGAEDLEMALAAMKQQYGLAQQGNLMNMMGMGMTPQFETIMRPEQASSLEQMMAQLSQIGLNLGSSYFGGMFKQPDFWKQPEAAPQPNKSGTTFQGPYSTNPAKNIL